MKKTSRLRSILREPNILIVPGAADAITARLIEEAGFDAVYATGAGIANAQFALPDIGLLSLTEMVMHIQRLVNAACELHREIGDWHKIDCIEIETFKSAYEIIAGDPEKWKPTRRETADHSLQYIVAAGLIDGQVVRETFSPGRLRDARIQQLLRQMKLVESSRFTAMYPESIPNKITVKTKDGTVHAREARYPLGHAGNKMTDEQVVEKFHASREHGWNDPEAQQWLNLVWKLEDVEPLRELANRLPKKSL